MKELLRSGRLAALLALLVAAAGAQSPPGGSSQAKPQPAQDDTFFDESESCPGTRQKTGEVRIGEYTVRTYRTPNMAGCFAVHRSGRPVHSEVAFLFEISGTPGFHSPKSAPPGTDVTGDGVSDLVMGHWSGGAHCCLTVTVYQIGQEFKKIGAVDVQHSIPHFSDSDGDGRWELDDAHDWTFAYWNASFAFSPAPEILLRFQDGDFRFAADLMRKPPPSQDQMANLLLKARADENWKRPEEIPADLYLPQVLLDLVYSGNAREAWQFLDQAWPAGRRGREKYLAEFRKQLAESPYWEQVKALNGGKLW